MTGGKDVDKITIGLVITPKKDFRKEGTYKSRVTLENGEYAEFSFQIKEQGRITGLELEYDQNTLCLGAKSGKATVTWVDAAGVEKDATLSNIKFSASDYNKIDGEIESDGSFTVKNDKDYVGDLIITAFDTSNKLSASFKITIGRELSGIQVVEPADSIAVDETGLVTIKFVDLDGSQVAFGNGEVSLENGYAISKPADAKVSVGEGAAFGKGLKEDGEATLEVKSDKAGDVTFFVNVSTKKDGDTNERYYTATFKVNFGEPKKVAEGAAKKVVMFIGSKGYTQDGVAKLTDVAPFIKDSRTFVAVRPVADAFGVTPENIGWNEATQTVTLTRDDMTVTIVIGSNDIEIVKDGVVSTVEADVPAFIADGRTVLPFRAVGDAFGVTTNWDEATQSVTYEQ
ncbi:MAG: copper amine oxidase N-terminal domain-containing protein [Peptococcia bacterium]